MRPDQVQLSLLCRVDGCLCAFPVEHVREIMRPLPLEAVAGAPPFVRGVSIIRGAPVPVVDAALILRGTESKPGRLVALKAGDRTIALAVQEVVGVWAIEQESLGDLPPLLREAESGAVAAIGARDGALMLVLDEARVVPEAVWERLRGAPPEIGAEE